MLRGAIGHTTPRSHTLNIRVPSVFSRCHPHQIHAYRSGHEHKEHTPFKSDNISNTNIQHNIPQHFDISALDQHTFIVRKNLQKGKKKNLDVLSNVHVKGVVLVASAASTHTLKKQSDGGSFTAQKQPVRFTRLSVRSLIAPRFATSHPQSHSSS